MVCPDYEAVAEIAWIHLFVKYEEWKKGKRSNTSSYETFLAHECTLTASSLEAVRGDILSLEGEWGNILKLKEVWGDILSFETAYYSEFKRSVGQYLELGNSGVIFWA